MLKDNALFQFDWQRAFRRSFLHFSIFCPLEDTWKDKAVYPVIVLDFVKEETIAFYHPQTFFVTVIVKT